MDTIIAIGGGLTVGFYLLFMIWVGTRTSKMTAFIISLIELCFERDKILDNRECDTWQILQKKLPSQNQMIFSCKPFTLENWLSAEDILKLEKHQA